MSNCRISGTSDGKSTDGHCIPPTKHVRNVEKVSMLWRFHEVKLLSIFPHLCSVSLYLNKYKPIEGHDYTVSNKNIGAYIPGLHTFCHEKYEKYSYKDWNP